MPMKSAPLVSGGRVVGRVCWRERVRKCFTCGRAGAELTCDGCDHVLGDCCSVSPTEGLDYCPKCFEPAYRRWLELQSASPSVLERSWRRASFRAWAQANAFLFLQLSKARTKKSLQEAPAVHVEPPAVLNDPSSGADEP
jgi:hypothetical protein